MLSVIFDIFSIKRWKYRRISGKTKQYLAAGASSFGFFAISVTYCWVTSMLALLSSGHGPIKATPYQASGLGVLAEIGMTVLAIPIANLANKWGRKPLLIATGPVTTVSWILIYFINEIHVLLAMRFIQGVMLGIFMGVLPIYLAEISSPSIRGSMSSLASIFWNLGFLYSNLIALFVSYEVHLILTCLPIAIYPLIFIWFNESPHYYLYKGLDAEAKKSLESFRDDNVEEELTTIKIYIEAEECEKASWKDLLYTKKGRSGLFMLYIMSFEAAIINSQLTYLSQISQDFHKGKYSTYVPTVIYGSCALLVSCFVNHLTDLIGRKPVVVIPSILNSLLLLVVSMYCVLNMLFVSMSKFWYVPISCNVIGLLFTAFGTPSALRLYQSELFSTPARSYACAISNILLSLITSLLFYLFEVAQVNDQLYLIFLLFSTLGIIMAVYTWIYVPETKGKTFQEIQNLL